MKNNVVTESESKNLPVDSGSYRGYWTGYSVSIPFEDGVELRFAVKNKSKVVGLDVRIVISEGQAYVREAVNGC